MAFAMLGPFTCERMVIPLGRKRTVIGNEQRHDFLEPIHVIAPRCAEPLPILQEMPCEVTGSGQCGALTCGASFQAHRKLDQRCGNALCDCGQCPPPLPMLPVGRYLAKANCRMTKVPCFRLNSSTSPSTSRQTPRRPPNHPCPFAAPAKSAAPAVHGAGAGRLILAARN